ncbi:prepilin-type N-terminal cleavage/methylation domain-containing protein [Patescibacteria group bacterium]|nr:prepilin-type N-terminal cleavage/methylation domain-containing protein [Patescibacteria group bacterium]
MNGKKENLISKQDGFSLMEMVVVLAVFSMTALMAVDLFVTITNVQRQVRNLQAVQSDARFAMESMVREVKTGTIDYEFYRGYCRGGSEEDGNDYSLCTSDFDCTVGGECLVVDLSDGPTDILVTRDHENNQILYRLNGDAIEVCSNRSLYRARCAYGANWQTVTPEKVKMTEMAMYIFPFSDPYSTKTSCTVHEDCDSGICDTDTNFCEIPDFQPMVTIVLESEAGKDEDQEKINLQTTATSMIYRR